MPLFKKGDENDVNNFRGLILVSCLSKLFTAVLNKRVNDWSEKYNTVSDAQFGFKKGFSTVAAIYLRYIVCVRDSPNGTIGNFTNGTIGSQ